MITRGRVFCPVESSLVFLSSGDNVIDFCKNSLCCARGTSVGLQKVQSSELVLIKHIVSNPLNYYWLVKREVGGQHKSFLVPWLLSRLQQTCAGVGLIPWMSGCLGHCLSISGLMPIYKETKPFQIYSDHNSGFFVIKS